MPHGRLATFVWMLPVAGFAVLSGLAAAYDRFPADLWLARRLQEIDAASFERTLDLAEDLADTPWVIIVWLAGIAALSAAARRWEAFLLFVSILARPLNVGAKELVERPRPSEDLVEVSKSLSSPAFPSGHADGVIVLYGLLFYFITLFVRQRAMRLLGQVVCVWVILFTGLERVYVGAHWPSDVLGGYYLGGMILAAIIVGRRLIAKRRGRSNISMPGYVISIALL